MWSETLVLLQNRSQTNKILSGLGLVSYDLGVRKFQGSFDGISEQPSAKRQQTYLFASYSHIVLETCSSDHLCCRVPLSNIDLITTYLVCNWADEKSKGFCKLVDLVEQLFCIVSTSASFEKKFSVIGSLFMHPWKL